jgi:NAD(P) transhydrogenase subunit alpha
MITDVSTHIGIDPFIFGITVFVLACFVGYYVVWRVTPALHTPLMAVTNAVSGIIIVGAIIAAGKMETPQLLGNDIVTHVMSDTSISTVLGFIAIVLASINIFGGFIVTQRMLQMFKKKEGGVKK